MLFGLEIRGFVEKYVRCVPEPLQAIALQHLEYFDPPDTCEFLKLAHAQGCYTG